MKIKNGRIATEEVMTDKELIFRSKFKEILEKWYGLGLIDIPEVMEKIGIRSKNYEIKDFINYACDLRYFTVKTKNTEYEIEMFRGNMIDPYPHIKVTNKGKDKFYSVKKVIQVERFK